MDRYVSNLCIADAQNQLKFERVAVLHLLRLTEFNYDYKRTEKMDQILNDLNN